MDVNLFSDVRRKSLEKCSDKGRRESIGAEMALMALILTLQSEIGTDEGSCLSPSADTKTAVLRRTIKQLTFPLPVKTTEQGKPYFHDENGAPLPLYFNLSHSGEYALAGLADFPLGVDIQYLKDGLPRYPQKLLSPSEYSHYEMLSEENKRLYFYECWAAKESYLKALGTGFDRRPSSFTAPKPCFSKRIIKNDPASSDAQAYTDSTDRRIYQISVSADPAMKKTDPALQDLSLTIISYEELCHLAKAEPVH